MADNNLNKKIFTNTYITGSGRHNYLRIDHLEDPLFTSFTFDIDYVTSPLFYTINYSDYGYPNVEGMANSIESSLKYMHGSEILFDEGYDILPLLSASILDGNKLGFGLQQNVYMDVPLYGATEYIYMVDKRNGNADQNDVMFDSNKFAEYGGNPNALNSYKLGDSVKSIVNNSDRAWAERKLQQNEEQISECDEIMKKSASEHKENKNKMNNLLVECNNVKSAVEGVSGLFTESQLQQKIDEYKNTSSSFEQLKKDIVVWANGEISQYQNRGTNIYSNNKCIQKIAAYSDIVDCDDDKKETYKKELISIFGQNFISEYISGGENSYIKKFNTLYNDLKKFLNLKNGEGRASIIESKIVNKFRDRLEYFGLCKKGDNSFSGDIVAVANNTSIDWVTKVSDRLPVFIDDDDSIEKSKFLMLFKCDIDLSFVDFNSDTTNKNNEMLEKYEKALNEVRSKLYGSKNGVVCDKSNATPDSLYGQYLEAKEKYENDDYSQAENAKALAKSGMGEASSMIRIDDHQQSLMEKNYESSIKNDAQPLELNRNTHSVVSQTVLDMLGFITGMKKMTTKYPYIIQGITGLDTAYNKHYGIKDPYLGSGEDKITLTCLESLDLRVSSMFNRYFNAVYDRQYRRERVPVNLRRFNCYIYVHDVRNFLSRIRFDKNGQQKVTYNRILELTDMYYSVIEFRFYDCEIIPEETGNIFNNVSNEAPSEMTKTNFTFTYGNCVVNFVPQSEVAAHDNIIVTNDNK